MKLMEVIPENPKYGYQPSLDTKSFYGFVGLKNLGATCYMNSMLQQFYMTPQFRYGILKVDDKLDPNIVETKKFGNIDDNMLH